MDSPEESPRRRGCLVTSLALAGAAFLIVAVAAAFVIRWSHEPASVGYRLLLVVRGEKRAEELVTEIIIERLAEEAGIPPAGVDGLKRELGPMSEDLPAMSEGEKHELAMLIRKAIGDGRLDDEEVALIREYSRKAARDGDDKP